MNWGPTMSNHTKNWTERLKILKSLHLQWDWGQNREILQKNLDFFSKRNMFVNFISKDQFSVDQVKEEIKTIPNMYDT